jgi:hypothetical protein
VCMDRSMHDDVSTVASVCMCGQGRPPRNVSHTHVAGPPSLSLTTCARACDRHPLTSFPLSICMLRANKLRLLAPLCVCLCLCLCLCLRVCAHRLCMTENQARDQDSAKLEWRRQHYPAARRGARHSGTLRHAHTGRERGRGRERVSRREIARA